MCSSSCSGRAGPALQRNKTGAIPRSSSWAVLLSPSPLSGRNPSSRSIYLPTPIPWKPQGRRALNRVGKPWIWAPRVFFSINSGVSPALLVAVRGTSLFGFFSASPFSIACIRSTGAPGPPVPSIVVASSPQRTFGSYEGIIDRFILHGSRTIDLPIVPGACISASITST
jgi:hypothetical protein